MTGEKWQEVQKLIYLIIKLKDQCWGSLNDTLIEADYIMMN